MKFNYSKLRGRIRECETTQAQLAEMIGINKSSLSVKLNGRYAFTNEEILSICKELHIANDEISKYFFCTTSSES